MGPISSSILYTALQLTMAAAVGAAADVQSRQSCLRYFTSVDPHQLPEEDA